MSKFEIPRPSKDLHSEAYLTYAMAQDLDAQGTPLAGDVLIDFVRDRMFLHGASREDITKSFGRAAVQDFTLNVELEVFAHGS